jgi:CspA family cold shock protein
MAERLTGIIQRIVEDRGFGFLLADGTEYFFHHTALDNCGIKALQRGDQVTFLPSNGPKGPRAEDIVKK